MAQGSEVIVTDSTGLDRVTVTSPKPATGLRNCGSQKTGFMEPAVNTIFGEKSEVTDTNLGCC